ncbi:MAG: MFS transporter [Propionibacteriales bacterium]|nr:MFS transporter [Propionibacteriales bacterium]
MTEPRQPSDPLEARQLHGDRQLLSTLVLITMVTAVVSSLGAPLVPAIAASYDVSLAAAQWALTATLLVGAVVTPILGRLGTGSARRPVILAGLGVVLAGAVLSALPLGYAALVSGRALQGVGLGLLPLALAVARDRFRGEDLTSAVALLSVSTVAGAGLGYPVTASVAEHLGLAGAYWFGALLVCCALVAAWRDIPALPGKAVERVDLPGALLLSAGMVAVLLAVSQGDRWGWDSAAVLGLGAAGAVGLLAWVWFTWRRASPLVDLRLAVRPGVAGPNAVALCAGIGMYGLLTLAVLVVQADGSAGFGLDRGISAAGLVLLPYAIFSVSGSRVARSVSRRFGPHVLLPIGCTVFASSLLFLLVWHGEVWQVLASMAIGGLGSGFTFSSLAVLIVPRVPAAETGSAMAFNQLLRYLGFSVGSALSVALLDVFGADELGLELSLAVLAGICLGAGVVVGLSGRGRSVHVEQPAP